MANIASQKKRNRQNEARRVRNKGVRSELRTRVKTARTAIAEDRKSTRLNSSHSQQSRMPSSA